MLPLFAVKAQNFGVGFLVKNIQLFIVVVGELSNFFAFFVEIDAEAELRLLENGDY